MVHTDGKPTIAMRESDAQLRDDILGITEVDSDPFAVGLELMVRHLTEEDFDRLLAQSNGWL